MSHRPHGPAVSCQIEKKDKETCLHVLFSKPQFFVSQYDIETDAFQLEGSLSCESFNRTSYQGNLKKKRKKEFEKAEIFFFDFNQKTNLFLNLTTLPNKQLNRNENTKKDK